MDQIEEEVRKLAKEENARSRERECPICLDLMLTDANLPGHLLRCVQCNQAFHSRWEEVIKRPFSASIDLQVPGRLGFQAECKIRKCRVSNVQSRNCLKIDIWWNKDGSI